MKLRLPSRAHHPVMKAIKFAGIVCGLYVVEPLFIRIRPVDFAACLSLLDFGFLVLAFVYGWVFG